MNKPENAVVPNPEVQMIPINFERKLRRSKEQIAAGEPEVILQVSDSVDMDKFNAVGLVSKVIDTELYKYAQFEGTVNEDGSLVDHDHFYTYLNNTLISQRFGTEEKKASAEVVKERLIEKGVEEAVAQMVYTILAEATLAKVKAQRPQDQAKMVEFLTACEQETYATQYQAWIDAEVEEAKPLDLSALTL
jgi:hypothetical protein